MLKRYRTQDYLMMTEIRLEGQVIRRDIPSLFHVFLYVFLLNMKRLLLIDNVNCHLHIAKASNYY